MKGSATTSATPAFSAHYYKRQATEWIAASLIFLFVLGLIKLRYPGTPFWFLGITALFSLLIFGILIGSAIDNSRRATTINMPASRRPHSTSREPATV